MEKLTNRQLKEIEHGKKILANAEKIWGREGLIGKIRIEKRAKLFIEKGNLKKGKKVLEIGCGTGELTYYLNKSKANIIATDIFKGFLDIARKKISSPNVQFKCVCGENLKKMPDNYFDTVCGTSVLHHLDIGTALENIYRVLKPNGTMIFSEPNMLNPQIIIQKNIFFIKKALGDSPDETAFFKWQMKNFLKKNKFRDINVVPFDFLHPALPAFLSEPAKNINYILESIPLIREFAGSLLIEAKK